MEEEKQKEVQQKYMELQMLNQQIQQIQRQVELLENQSMELTIVNNSLDELKNVDTGTEILVSIGRGIFAKADVKDTNELIVNVGADVAVKKDIHGTKNLITGQLGEIKKLQQEMLTDLQKIAAQASSIENEINNVVSETKK